jgi:hypothetical protein
MRANVVEQCLCMSPQRRKLLLSIPRVTLVIIAVLFTQGSLPGCRCLPTPLAPRVPSRFPAPVSSKGSHAEMNQHRHSSLISGTRFRGRQRCTILRAKGGAGKSFMASISTVPGKSRVFTCTSTTSVEMPTVDRWRS